MNGLILYTTEDGKSRIQLRADEQTVWLTQLEMADLFDTTKQNVSLHLKNLSEDGELDPMATVKESLTVQIEGVGGNYRGILGSSNGGRKREAGVSWCRCGSGFQPFVVCVSQKPRALPWAGMAPAFGLQNPVTNQRQRRNFIPAWGNAPGSPPQTA